MDFTIIEERDLIIIYKEIDEAFRIAHSNWEKEPTEENLNVKNKYKKVLDSINLEFLNRTPKNR